MTKELTRFSQTVIDLIILSVALTLAFLIRFDFSLPGPMLARLLVTGPYVVVLEYLVLLGFGVRRLSWRYVSLRETSQILKACLAFTIVLIGARVLVGELQRDAAYLHQSVIPFGVLAINTALSFLAIGGVRFARRMWAEGAQVRKRRPVAPGVRTILLGAGEAGVLVARELAGRPDLAVRAVGFLDDDPRKKGTVIHGLPVLGGSEDLPQVCAKLEAKQALITMANVPGSAIRRIRRLCEDAEIPVKIIPGLYEIVGGTVNLSRMRDIAIEDLLRRDRVDLDDTDMQGLVHSKVVLTTGSGGSIGSELCRQICRLTPSRLVLVERSENALFNIHRELSAAYPELEIVPCIADITDAPRMRELVTSHRPSLILHAAAHKHVPIMEWNPGEGIKNNLFGTKTVADIAVEAGVDVFVMISTDKAVNPSSVMGATKRAAEVYLQSLAQGSATRIVTVRFGNVLGSSGSVVPIFQQQIAQGGPVTVTHPDMRRYFMTIPEACQLVLQAGAMGKGGEIFVLDMGEPVKIVDLARDLIALSGLREGDDIEIVFTGSRPGEKLFEELSTAAEDADKTRHPKIFVGRLHAADRQVTEANLAALARVLEGGGDKALLAALRQMVPEFESAPSVAVDAAPEPTRERLDSERSVDAEPEPAMVSVVRA
ncbi:MAG TPA: nucleoside-diphosphate sugar epimerase/dehydratase [Polyangiaceae bacterium]|nr:nucleoside-diphosphate sugar epimerase/dehydratase [Polyangiaceae bacterium]